MNILCLVGLHRWHKFSEVLSGRGSWLEYECEWCGKIRTQWADLGSSERKEVE